MRPRTKIPIPEPTGTEFENFDRFTGILLARSVKDKKPKRKTKSNGRTKRQRGRLRLPRP